MGLFDIHAHLTDARLLADEQGVIDRARAAGVTTIVSNGLHPLDNQAVLELAARHPEVRPALGLYPVDAVLVEWLAMGGDYPHQRAVPGEEAIEWVADHVHQAVAVGEIGLDHHYIPEPLWDLQEQRFRALVRIAMDADLPIIIHTRKAERRTFEVLLEMKAPRVNWHCYSSKLKLAKQIAEAGHFLSVPANAVRAENFQRMLTHLPRHRLLLETDCPYLGPVKDELNEPCNVAVTARLAASLWSMSEEDAVDLLSANFEALMGFAP